jgi:tetratricopeptide (TPR) repeat protein
MQEREKIPGTAQSHTGGGDNVVGDKILQQAISPTAIKPPIEKVLWDITVRQLDSARDNFLVIKKTSSLDPNSLILLDIVEALIKLPEGNIPHNSRDSAQSYLRDNDDPFGTDIAYSLLLRLAVKSGDISLAQDVYQKAKYKGTYLYGAFYELIANSALLSEDFEARKHELTEEEVNGLVRGALREQEYKFAFEVANFLQQHWPNKNSNVLALITKVNMFSLSHKGKHYWTYTATSKNALFQLCNEAALLLNDVKAKDKRIVQSADILMHYTVGDSDVLVKACRKHLSAIESIDSDFAKSLNVFYQADIGEAKTVAQKLIKARNNKNYRDGLVTEVLTLDSISPDDSVLLANIADKQSMQRWINKGGVVVGKNSLEEDFSLLELEILACDDNPKSIDNVRIRAKKFIDNHKAELNIINPMRLVELVDSLNQVGLATISCELVKSQIPEADLWPSPFVKSYLHALLLSNQFMTLENILDEIGDKEWDEYVWEIKARQLAARHQYDDAVFAARQAIKINPLSDYLWHFLVSSLTQIDNDSGLITQEINKIPSELFQEPSDFKYSLLLEITRRGEFKKCEKYLLDWFINDPDGNAKKLTNFHFGLTVNDDIKINPSYELGSCYGGVRFQLDDELLTRLLVPDGKESHQYLLGISSPLGSLLKKLEVGDIVEHGMQTITLKERLPPYVAAFQISMQHRQALNDGSDPFYFFQLPSDSNEMVKTLERKLARLNRNDNELYAQGDIPLFMKGMYYSEYEPVKAALYHLTSKDSLKPLFPAFGNESPEYLIVDVYSACYLALTGLMSSIKHLPVKTVITLETKQCIQNWLEEINDKNFMTIGLHPNGGLWRSTKEDIQRETHDIQKALLELIEISSIPAPFLVDIPPDVVQLDGLVDISIFSSIKLSITNSIPWLCIDLPFAQLSKVAGYEVINAVGFLGSLVKESSFEGRKKGLYAHVLYALPFPYTYEDLIQLSTSKEAADIYYLSELLRMHPDEYNSANTAIEFLSTVVASALLNLYLGKEQFSGISLREPLFMEYVQRVFNVSSRISMKYGDGAYAEHKYAVFIASLLDKFRDATWIRKDVLGLAGHFIAGHFLDVETVNEQLKQIFQRL